MSKTKLLSLFFCFMFLMLNGCSKPVTYEERNQISLVGPSKAQGMAEAEKVLSKMQFSIEKFDVESGFIKCHPLRGGQWFEFWRKDNVGKFNKAEANLHTLRRLVTVEVAEEAGRLIIKCDADTQKLDLTEKKYPNKRNSGSKIYDMFSSGERLQNLNLEAKKKTWIDLGEDRQLEGAILTKIENRLKEKKI